MVVQYDDATLPLRIQNLPHLYHLVRHEFCHHHFPQQNYWQQHLTQHVHFGVCHGKLKSFIRHVWTIGIDVRRVPNCIRRRATLSMLRPNLVILYKSLVDQMRNDCFSIFINVNISAVDPGGCLWHYIKKKYICVSCNIVLCVFYVYNENNLVNFHTYRPLIKESQRLPPYSSLAPSPL